MKQMQIFYCHEKIEVDETSEANSIQCQIGFSKLSGTYSPVAKSYYIGSLF